MQQLLQEAQYAADTADQHRHSVALVQSQLDQERSERARQHEELLRTQQLLREAQLAAEERRVEATYAS